METLCYLNAVIILAWCNASQETTGDLMSVACFGSMNSHVKRGESVQVMPHLAFPENPYELAYGAERFLIMIASSQVKMTDH